MPHLPEPPPPCAILQTFCRHSADILQKDQHSRATVPRGASPAHTHSTRCLMTQHDPYTCLPLPQPFWVEPKTGYMSPSPCAEQHVLCADRRAAAVAEGERRVRAAHGADGRPARLEKVLALIDKGVSPQTARNRHTIALHNDVLRWLHILPYAMDVERSVRKDPTR